MTDIHNQELYYIERAKEYIQDYWTKRSDGFAKLRGEELRSEKYQRWELEIMSQLPQKDNLKILDIGCGVGFFSILLSKHGHQVTGVDLTESMIDKANQLADEENVNAGFMVMDAEKLVFPEDFFDVVISRNLTWTLPHPDKAYAEWLRVLKPDGVLLNYDAEYARNHHSQTLPENHAHDYVSGELMKQCHDIYHMLDISTKQRPVWDMEILQKLPCSECDVNIDIGNTIYKEQDMFYIPAPMFRIRAVKKRNEL